MRAVLYAHDMEPITVLELGGCKWEYLKEHGCLRLAVFTTPATTTHDGRPLPSLSGCRSVLITAEWLNRRGHEIMMLFTCNEEDAMLLKAAFLPGQRSELREHERAAFAKGFMSAWQSFG
jgi:hypothetical protein